MIPINKKKLAEQRAHLYATSGRGVIEERMAKWDAEHPTIPCETCKGKCTFIVHVDGTRDHDIARASAAKGDVAVPCETCAGWGFRRVTKEEFIAYVEAENDKRRAEFRALRDEVCRLRGMTSREFVAMAQKRLPPNPNAPSPADWLRAATEVARMFR